MTIKISFIGHVCPARHINVLKAEEKSLLLGSMETAVEESTPKKVDSDDNVLHESSEVVAHSCRELGLDKRGRRRYLVEVKLYAIHVSHFTSIFYYVKHV